MDMYESIAWLVDKENNLFGKSPASLYDRVLCRHAAMHPATDLCLPRADRDAIASKYWWTAGRKVVSDLAKMLQHCNSKCTHMLPKTSEIWAVALRPGQSNLITI